MSISTTMRPQSFDQRRKNEVANPTGSAFFQAAATIKPFAGSSSIPKRIYSFWAGNHLDRDRAQNLQKVFSDNQSRVRTHNGIPSLI
jgi:hypothetical protein